MTLTNMKFPILRTIFLASILVLSSVAADDQSESGTFLPLETNFMCGVRLASGFILGGQDAKRGEFPFIAALGYRSSQGRKSIAFLVSNVCLSTRFLRIALRQ